MSAMSCGEPRSRLSPWMDIAMPPADRIRDIRAGQGTHHRTELLEEVRHCGLGALR